VTRNDSFTSTRDIAQRLKCANSGHSWTALGTGQFDAKPTFGERLKPAFLQLNRLNHLAHCPHGFGYSRLTGADEVVELRASIPGPSWRRCRLPGRWAARFKVNAGNFDIVLM
jgi:hypothetical protein